MFRWFKKPAKTNPPSPWDIGISSLRNIESIKFQNIYQPQYSLIKVMVPFTTLEEYKKKLQLFVDYCKEDRVIPIMEFDKPIQSIDLPLLFNVDEGRKYGQPVKGFDEFREIAIEALSFMNHNESFAITRNQAIAHRVMSSLLQLTKELVELE